jgi:hypothetical protein
MLQCHFRLESREHGHLGWIGGNPQDQIKCLYSKPSDSLPHCELWQVTKFGDTLQCYTWAEPEIQDRRDSIKQQVKKI